MPRIIIGLALATALALLAAGANFGCSQNAADPLASGSINQPQQATGQQTVKGSCPCGK